MCDQTRVLRKLAYQNEASAPYKQYGNFKSMPFFPSASPYSVFSMVGEVGKISMSCKRKFRELKTALKKFKKLWWKNKKSTRYGTKCFCYKLFAHSALHSPGTETKSATRFFIIITRYKDSHTRDRLASCDRLICS